MAPAPGSSPPTSPTLTSSTSSLATPLSPFSPQDYGHIVRSIQHRSASRLSEDHSAASWRVRGSSASSGGGGMETGTEVNNSLENDLKLAAEIGQALLQEKSSMQQKLDSMEKANQKLFIQLSSSVKENNQLQRRLEETVGNLEQADSSNRALLVSLEEDRKTISRLSADAGKLVATSTTLKDLQRTHDDTLQELASERKRASAAENKGKRIGERANELEERLKTAIADLEEMRQDKVLRSRKSGDALAKVRAKYARGEGESDERAAKGSTTSDSVKNAETDELLKLVENLVTENNLLRSESMELHGLLESTREEQGDMRSSMAERDVVPEEDEEEVRRAENDEDDLPSRFDQRRLSMFSATSAPPESITSPSLSQGGFDLDSYRVPLSPGSSAFQRPWGASPFSSHGSDLNRPSGIDLVAGEDSSAHTARPPASVRRSNSLRGRRQPAVSSNSTGALNSSKVPFGRRKGHNGRSLSMDISSSIQAGQGPSPLVDPGSAPGSPNPNFSPSTRPASIFSNASEDPDSSARPRRHHRPLSLSLGPSLFPGVPEDDSSRPVSPYSRASAAAHRRKSSQPPLAPSDSAAESLVSIQSGLGIASTTLASNEDHRQPMQRVLTDFSTQTSPPPSPLETPRSPLPSLSQPFSNISTPHRSPHSHPYRSPSLSPKPNSARSHTSVSDLSEERLFEAQVVSGAGVANLDQRTAALGQLLEHVVKLLGRLQTADVATQSKRLAKQNLPGGDVKHVAQANLKDLVNEIDSMRDKFRRILEQERAAVAKDVTKAVAPPSAESLISRREFVSLVKLLRDLLFEASRLRSLVNRVQLDPSLATRLADFDDAQVSAADLTGQSTPKATTAGGLLAPLSRLFGTNLSPGEHPTLASRPSSAQLRAPPKRGGYSAVTSATVNVEFGKAAVRSSSSEGTTTSPSQPPPSRPDPPRRDISSIFAGSSNRPADPWVVLPNSEPGGTAPTPMPQPRRMPSRSPGLASVASSYLPFSRILAGSYRPAMSSTTNAVLDSIPHAPPSSRDLSSNHEPGPTLLERQLRPRGLSDSSIRSTFLSHGVANPHHRVLTPATLALSSEPTRVATTTVVAESSSLSTSPAPGSSLASSGLGAISALQKQLSADEGLLSVSSSGSGSLSRRSSATNLRSKPSQSRLRDQVLAPSSAPLSVDRSNSLRSTDTSPSLLTSTSPNPIQISPPSPLKRPAPHHANSSMSSSPVDRTTAPNSLFGTLASGWSNGWTSGPAGGGGGSSMPESYKERTRMGRD